MTDPKLLMRARLGGTKIVRPHSFQAAADELASSSGGPAGSSVPGRSEEPATPMDTGAIYALFEKAKEGHTARRRPAIHGYDSFDIEFAMRGVEAATDLFLSAVKGYLDTNEHVASFVDFEGFTARIYDMVADEMRGPLQKGIDELRGDR